MACDDDLVASVRGLMPRGLNDAAGYDAWAYVPLPAELYAVDRDAIRNAIIWSLMSSSVIDPSWKFKSGWVD
jgi:hypothetical protein